eukprot:12936765-Prorocentrum_lima.AAC.1
MEDTYKDGRSPQQRTEVLQLNWAALQGSHPSTQATLTHYLCQKSTLPQDGRLQELRAVRAW